MNILTVTIVLGAAVFSSSTVIKTPENGAIPPNFELLILHNNDMHARFEQTSQLSGACTTADRAAGKCYGGFPRVAHVVKEARRKAASGEGPPVLYLNAGDTYTGTAWFTIYKWKIAAEFINALKPDAVSLGNHELDELVDGLVPFIKNISTPVVAANLILDEVPQLKDIENLQDSVILAKNGIKIGVIGYLTPDTAFLAPKNKIIYEDEIPAIRREVQKLKNLGVDILIALGHSGYIKDIEIAKKVEGLDLIIGGHSNTFLWNGENNEKPEITQGPYPVVVNDPSGRKVLVVQAYAYTKYMGNLHLTFDSKGEVIEFGGSPILLDNSIPKDPELLDIVETYKKDVNRISNEVVGVSDVFLNGDCRLRECNMGNFITDVLLNCSAGQYPEVTITICQSGRIRASIDAIEKPFNLTKGEWMGVLPFTDTMTIVTMNGSVLRMVLEHSVAVWRPIDSVGQFLQFSGMTVVYDLLRPAGSRIIEAYAACPKCGDKLSAIKDNYEYKVMMPSFLAEGGDGYSIFVGLPQEHCNYNEITCIYEYLEKYPTISPKLTGRIKLLNEEKAVAIFKVDNTRIDSRLPSNSPSLQSSNYGRSIIYLSVLSCILISRIYM